MLRKHRERNIPFECLVAMSAVAAATMALIFGLIVSDLQIRSQRSLGATYTWTWVNNGDVRAQTEAGPQQERPGGRLPRVGWQAVLMLMGAAAVLIGGIVFSLLKMRGPRSHRPRPEAGQAIRGSPGRFGENREGKAA
jgi:hypothetical protein